MRRSRLEQLLSDRWALTSLTIILLYAWVALATRVGWIASPWDGVVGVAHQAPQLGWGWDAMPLWFGTDLFGRSVLFKVLHGARIAMSVGFVSTLISVPIGVSLGAIAGYFGGKWDDAIVWFYTVLSAIPGIMLLIAVAYVLGRGTLAVYLSLGLTSWVGIARVMRGEFMKHREREYVLSAQSLGAGHLSRIFRHILPNVMHLVIIQSSVMFMSAVKAEVILSFLGLGIQGQPSWGIMIDDAKMELAQSVWWQLAGASGALFVLVLALNLFGDALRDAFDPKVN